MRKNGRKNGKNGRNGKRTGNKFSKRFTLGKTRVNSWDAWLVIGFAAAVALRAIFGNLQKEEEIIIPPLPIVEASQNSLEALDNTSGPLITSLSSSSGPSGTTIIVKGSGFSSVDNVIYFGEDIVASVPSTDCETLSFNVPQVPSDIYFVGVLTYEGKSNVTIFTILDQMAYD